MKTAGATVFVIFALVVASNARANTPTPQGDQATVARTAAGCGPSNVDFDVKTDDKQHPLSQPEPGKALVYFLHIETADGGVINKGWVTSRVGIDGNWVGANHGKSYFFVSLDPGQHAVCTDWQSRIKAYSSRSAATSSNAETGKVYFIRTTVMETTPTHQTPGLKLEVIDNAEGQLLVSSSALSTSHAKE